MDLFISMFLTFVFPLLASIQVTESKDFLRVCYFTSWSNSRQSRYARFDIDDIDPSLCTHIIYAFARLDRFSKLLVPSEPLVEDSRPGYVGRYRKFNNLKNKHSHLKTLLSIGGQYAGNDGFKAITENEVILQRFAKNTVEFLRKRDFDGIDIDWEYPNKETRRAFISLLQALRQAFDAESTSHKLLLTVAGPAGKWTIDPGYDIPGIARFVDFVNLMTYDYHVAGSEVAAFNSPLYSRKDVRFNPTLSMNWTTHYWMERGLPAHKTVVGVTGVGRRFVLNDVNDTLVGSMVTKESRRGSFYGIASGLAYPEICVMQDGVSTIKYFDAEQAVPYMVDGDDWVGYEDPQSLKGKVEWMLKVGVAGIMIWSLDQDDFTGQACNEGKYPLLKAIAEAVGADKNPDSTDQSGTTVVRDTTSSATPGRRTSRASTPSTHEVSNNRGSSSTTKRSVVKTATTTTTKVKTSTGRSHTTMPPITTTSGSHFVSCDNLYLALGCWVIVQMVQRIRL